MDLRVLVIIIIMTIFTAHSLDHFQSMATSPLILLDCHTVIFNPSFEAELVAPINSIPPRSINSASLSSYKNISVYQKLVGSSSREPGS